MYMFKLEFLINQAYVWQCCYASFHHITAFGRSAAQLLYCLGYACKQTYILIHTFTSTFILDLFVFRDGRAFTWEEYDELIALVKFCQEADPIHQETGSAGSVTYILLCQAGFKVIAWVSYNMD